MPRAQHAPHPPGTVKRTSKVYTVPISSIRIPPAGVCQREFRPWWGAYLTKNLALEELGLPVMNHRDGVYWAVDGQHRIHALRENGFGDDRLECEVFENLTDKEMAQIFRGRNTRKAVAAMDAFLVACTAGVQRECEIRHAVTSCGLAVGRSRVKGHLACVGGLMKAWDLGGVPVLVQTLRALNTAYQGDSVGFDANLVVGLASFCHRYQDRVDERILADRLGSVARGARGLLQRAETMRMSTGNQKVHCIAAVIVEVYNRGAKHGNKLQSWWKADDCPPPEAPSPRRRRAAPANGQHHASV